MKPDDEMTPGTFIFDCVHLNDSCTCPGKWCPSCEQVKCFGTFNRCKTGKYGLYTCCRACQSARSKEYHETHGEEINERSKAWRQNNAERHREYTKAYWKAHPEEHREHARAYRQSDPERHRSIVRAHRERHPETDKLYYERNRDKHYERVKSYRQRNLEQYAIYTANRKARKERVGGSITLQQWEELKQHYDYTCLSCGRQEPEIILTMDHVIPITGGGINSIENIQPLCRSCNSGKGTKVIDYRERFHRGSL